MNEENKTLIMLIGKTHSGKTTFANELKEQIKDLLVLEADPIAAFMEKDFPELRKNDYNDPSGAFKKISLKVKTFLLFVEFAMSLGKPIILSNSNMYIEGRKLVFSLCKKFNYRVVGVYFDFPEELLVDRIKTSGRDTVVLRKSVNFPDLIVNQRTRMQPPESSEFDEFLVVKSEEKIPGLKNKLIQKFT